MLARSHREEILGLIEKLVVIETQAMKVVPSSYADLQRAVMMRELSDQSQILQKLFLSELNEAELQARFKVLCAGRDKANQDTCLSYSAIPEGFCNRLYWDIAVILFNPKNMQEMLEIIAPSIKTMLSFNLAIETETHPRKQLQDRLRMKWTRESCAALADYPVAVNFLNRVLMGQGIIFTLDQVKELPLFLHMQLYECLNEIPKFQKKLYTHNEHFKQLLMDIEWLRVQGTTPDEALTRLRKELLRAGSTYTGANDAAESAFFALVQFLDYLNRLPLEKRNELEALKYSSNTTLANILKSLYEKQCVQAAASNIQSIQGNPSYHPILRQLTPATKEQKQDLAKRYHKPIDISGYDSANALPSILEEKVLRKVELNDVYSYIDLLINLPPSTYLTLLKFAKITSRPPIPHGLAAQISMLNAEQREAFNNAIISQIKKMGSKRNILYFAIESENFTLLQKLSTVYRNNRTFLSELRRLRAGGSPLRFACKKNSAVLSFLLSCFTPQKRWELVQGRADNDTSLLSFAIIHRNEASAMAILNSLSEVHQWAILNEENGFVMTPIEQALDRGQVRIFNALYDFLDKKNKISILKRPTLEKAVTQLYLLLKLKCIPIEIIERHLMLYTSDERLSIIKDPNVFINGRSLTYRITIDKPVVSLREVSQDLRAVYLRILLKSVAEKDRFSVMQGADSGGKTLLHHAATDLNPDLIRVLLECLPPKDRQLAVLMSDGSDTVLQLLEKNENPEVLAAARILLKQRFSLRLFERNNVQESLPHEEPKSLPHEEPTAKKRKRF